MLSSGGRSGGRWLRVCRTNQWPALLGTRFASQSSASTGSPAAAPHSSATPSSPSASRVQHAPSILSNASNPSGFHSSAEPFHECTAADMSATPSQNGNSVDEAETHSDSTRRESEWDPEFELESFRLGLESKLGLGASSFPSSSAGSVRTDGNNRALAEDPSTAARDATDSQPHTELIRALVECKAETAWNRFQDLHSSNQLGQVPVDDLISTLQAIARHCHVGTTRNARVQFLASTIRLRPLSHHHYARLIPVLLQAGYCDLGLESMQEMESAGSQLSDSLPSDALGRIIRCLVQHRRVEDALNVFRRVAASNNSPLASHLISECMQAFARQSDYEGVHSFARLKEQYGSMSVGDFISMGTVCLRLEKMDEANRWLDAAVATGQPLLPDDVLRIVSACSLTGSVEQGCFWFEHFVKSFPDEERLIEAFNYMIWGHVKAKQLDKAVQLLDRMKKSGPAPTLVTYNLLMDGFNKLQDYRSTLRLFLEMKRLPELSPNEYTYTIAINALAKSRRMEKALDMVQAMQDVEVAPNLVTYNTILHGYVKSGSLNRAIQLYRYLRGLGVHPDKYTLTTLMFGAVFSNDVEFAGAMFDEMKARGVELGWHTFTAILYIHAKRRDLESAKETLNEVDHRYIPSSSMVHIYNAYLYALLECNDPAQVPGVLARMKERGIKPNVGTYTMLMELSSLENRCDNVLKLFNFLIKDPDVEKVDERIVAAVFRILGRHQHVDAVKIAYSNMRTGQSRQKVDLGPFAWKTYLSVLLEHDEIESAKQAFYDVFPATATQSPHNGDLKTSSSSKATQPILVDERTLSRVLAMFKKKDLWSELDEMMRYLESHQPQLATPSLADSPNLDRDLEDASRDPAIIGTILANPNYIS